MDILRMKNSFIISIRQSRCLANTLITCSIVISYVALNSRGQTKVGVATEAFDAKARIITKSSYYSFFDRGLFDAHKNSKIIEKNIYKRENGKQCQSSSEGFKRLTLGSSASLYLQKEVGGYFRDEQWLFLQWLYIR